MIATDRLFEPFAKGAAGTDQKILHGVYSPM